MSMTRIGPSILGALCAGALVAGTLASRAGAAPVESFYAGKTITITVGTTTGGSYDAYARLGARHYPRYIPGAPSVVVKNLPGASGIKAAQHLNNVATKDGTDLGAIHNTIPTNLLFNPGKFAIDIEKFTWVGSIASPANVLVVWHTTGMNSIVDAKTKEVTIGSTTAGGTKEIFPLIANALLRTKFKIINGYLGGAEVNLAMERGEVQGHGANSWVSYQFQNSGWVRDKKIVPLFQVTFERDPALPDVPTLMECAETDEQRHVIVILTTTEALGRPLVAPPGLPGARAEILRRAFDATMKDTGFLADAAKAGLEISPMSGEKLQAMVTAVMQSPPDIVTKYKQIVAGQE